MNPLPELTLPQMLRQQARLQPARIAVRQKDFGIWNPIHGCLGLQGCHNRLREIHTRQLAHARTLPIVSGQAIVTPLSHPGHKINPEKSKAAQD